MDCTARKGSIHNLYEFAVMFGEQQYVVNTAFTKRGTKDINNTYPIIDGTLDTTGIAETKIVLTASGPQQR